MMNDLKILSWNYNGIGNRTSELTTFIKMHNVNIILLGETCLDPITPLKIRNFHTYRTDHQQRPRTPPNGGTAVLIRCGIVNIQTELDSTSVNTKLTNNIAQVTAVYKSPSVTLKPTDLNNKSYHSPKICQ